MNTEASSTPLVTLIGAPGSGKTKVGKRVARMLGVPFIDSDKRIVAEHGPIAQIFEKFGEPHFRALERDAIVATLGEAAVLSLGGGAVVDPQTRADLRGRRVVRLTVSAEAVRGRITGGKRPLLGAGVEAWKILVASRQAFYEEVADATWDTSTRPIDQIAREIAEWVAADAGLPMPSEPRHTSADDKDFK